MSLIGFPLLSHCPPLSGKSGPTIPAQARAKPVRRSVEEDPTLDTILTHHPCQFLPSLLYSDPKWNTWVCLLAIAIYSLHEQCPDRLALLGKGISALGSVFWRSRTSLEKSGGAVEQWGAPTGTKR